MAHNFHFAMGKKKEKKKKQSSENTGLNKIQCIVNMGAVMAISEGYIVWIKQL